MIRRLFKRHFFLLLSGMMTLIMLFTVGYTLTQYINDPRYTDILPGANNPYLVAWRIMFYGVLIYYWKPIVGFVIRKRGVAIDNRRLDALVEYRKAVAIICIGFEILVVQNPTGLLLSLIFSGG